MRILLSRFIGKVANLRLRYFSIPLIRIFRLAFKIKDRIDVKNHQSLNDFSHERRQNIFHYLKAEDLFVHLLKVLFPNMDR